VIGKNVEMTPILFLTIHKTASRFMSGEFLPMLAKAAGLSHFDPGRQRWTKEGEPRHPDYGPLAREQNTLIGPVRDPRTIADAAAFDSWKKILLLRDPRDVLTSLYFSVSVSHSRPPEGPAAARFDSRRESAQSMSIDDYMIHLCDGDDVYRLRYLDYMHRFADRPNVLLLRYEQMIADWDKFLDQLLAFCEVAPNPAVDAEMRNLRSEFTVSQENPAAHKRQVAPGDAFRKLKPETMAVLNRRYKPILDWLGSSAPAL
jgi:hypothetical protein